MYKQIIFISFKSPTGKYVLVPRKHLKHIELPKYIKCCMYIKNNIKNPIFDITDWETKPKNCFCYKK